MPGYPDSHLNPSRVGPKSRRVRLLLAAIPIIVAVGWLCYFWFIMGVFPATEKYPSGQIKSSGYVRRAGVEAYKRHGHWVTYHANGRRSSEGEYVNGEKTGDWHYWDENGREMRAEIPVPEKSVAGK